MVLIFVLFNRNTAWPTATQGMAAITLISSSLSSLWVSFWYLYSLLNISSTVAILMKSSSQKFQFFLGNWLFKYKLVWGGFLNTFLPNVPSFLYTKTSRKGSCRPLQFSCELKWLHGCYSRNPQTLTILANHLTKSKKKEVSSTYLLKHTGVNCAVLFIKFPPH